VKLGDAFDTFIRREDDEHSSSKRCTTTIPSSRATCGSEEREVEGGGLN
jgi:hypothetical protein